MNLPPGYTDYGRSSHSPAVARGSLSYITGSHAFKVGAEMMQGFGTIDVDPNRNVAYTFRNQVPVALTQVASGMPRSRIKPQLGIYGQDQWVLKSLTINLGSGTIR